ncbi:MAG: hypothetical protein C0407_18695 [Desulfobacca sp.]|nr:hypothetical protein [Desulfobacca sp.]
MTFYEVLNYEELYRLYLQKASAIGRNAIEKRMEKRKRKREWRKMTLPADVICRRSLHQKYFENELDPFNIW